MNAEFERDMKIAEKHGWHPWAVWMLQFKILSGIYRDEPPDEPLLSPEAEDRVVAAFRALRQETAS